MTSNASPHHLAALGVVIVAAGTGERLGADRPKAFVELGGRTLLEHAVRTVVSLDRPGQLVLVVPESHAAEALEIAEATAPADGTWQVSVVGGGRERHESVRKGLDALFGTIETVLVHDAARPLTPASVFERVADEVVRTGDGVIPAMPVVDTLKRVDASGTVRSTADRRILVAVQTPQGFPVEALAAAHESAQALEESASPSNDAPTDDAEVMQRFGGTVRTIPGDARSHKLTTPEDLLMLQGLLFAAAEPLVAAADTGQVLYRYEASGSVEIPPAPVETADPFAQDPADAAPRAEPEVGSAADVPADVEEVAPEVAEVEVSLQQNGETVPDETATIADIPGSSVETAEDADEFEPLPATDPRTAGSAEAAEPEAVHPLVELGFLANDEAAVDDDTAQVPLVLPPAPPAPGREEIESFDSIIRGDG
ncbi:MAG: 2-C-methyl-D-erythritol 4-phosphate cytidylyltransferase [Actinobacteria bacterium]|nr:2-C-methyl-D-erythritol 4-phosphate cytidylyltransferase [Actinomycetota bacterium]